jgi:glycosyltransferase involved in cell wall biosynthesis
MLAPPDGVPPGMLAPPDGVRPGMLVPAGDPVALADALRRWLTRPEVRGDLRAAAAARRSTLDGWDATARALAAALETL